MTGTVETLTATLTPPGAAGTVQFSDGSTPLGSPVTVTSGAAQITTTLPIGTHSLSVMFTPTDPVAFTSSTSSAVPYVVYATATTTTLRAIPNPTFVNVPVILIATVAPSAPREPSGSLTAAPHWAHLSPSLPALPSSPPRHSRKATTPSLRCSPPRIRLPSAPPPQLRYP